MDRLGPKDSRLRRRRCVQCVLAHLKCSGLLPCHKCVRRGQCCTYQPAPKGTIFVENGRHFTPGDILSNSTVAPLCVRRNIQYFDQYFELFVTTNNFSYATSVWIQYLRTSIGRDPMVATATTATGMLHAYKTMPADSKDEGLLKRALSTYQEAVNILRKYLTLPFGDVDLCATISATFLLGLFELMYDQTGDGWKRHMMYGIARLLDLSEPATFYSEAMRSLYGEVRLFEITRAVLLSQSTALTKSSWLCFNHKLLGKDGSLHPKEAIFDLMLNCADLSRRVHLRVNELDVAMHEKILQLQTYAAEGLRLQQQLLNVAKTIFTPQKLGREREQTMLAQLYYFATMIYLSGVYDYDYLWQEHSFPIPVLSRSSINEYVQSILDYSVLAMHNSAVSQLLLLVPLRIAAARCRTQEQQRQIQELLSNIQATFAVAHAFLVEIRGLWASR